MKQTKNIEENKRMWYLIKQTVRDPQSQTVLKVQQVVNGEVQEYETQKDIENAIQRECKVRFSLAHSTPIMSTLLGEHLEHIKGKATHVSIE